MNCLTCGNPTYVKNTRGKSKQRLMRRRECTSCGKRFTTYEVREEELKQVDTDQVAAMLQQHIADANAMLLKVL